MDCHFVSVVSSSRLKDRPVSFERLGNDANQDNVDRLVTSLALLSLFLDFHSSVREGGGEQSGNDEGGVRLVTSL